MRIKKAVMLNEYMLCTKTQLYSRSVRIFFGIPSATSGLYGGTVRLLLTVPLPCAVFGGQMRYRVCSFDGFWNFVAVLDRVCGEIDFGKFL